MLTFNPQTSEFAQNYKFLIGSILPRPIAVVSTRNEDGSNNLAPFSFFTAVSANPMIVAFSPLIRSSTGLPKDTYKNIQRTKEMVINFCPEEIADQINLASTELPYGEDEFTYAKLTPIPSEKVNVARMQESPIHFECVLRDTLTYGEGIGSGSLITAEVICVHISEEIYDNGHIVTQNWKPIGRGAGNDWFKTDSVVEKKRLMQTQIQK